MRVAKVHPFPRSAPHSDQFWRVLRRGNRTFGPKLVVQLRRHSKWFGSTLVAGYVVYLSEDDDIQERLGEAADACLDSLKTSEKEWEAWDDADKWEGDHYA